MASPTRRASVGIHKLTATPITASNHGAAAIPCLRKVEENAQNDAEEEEYFIQPKHFGRCLLLLGIFLFFFRVGHPNLVSAFHTVELVSYKFSCMKTVIQWTTVHVRAVNVFRFISRIRSCCSVTLCAVFFKWESFSQIVLHSA